MADCTLFPGSTIYPSAVSELYPCSGYANWRKVIIGTDNWSKAAAGADGWVKVVPGADGWTKE